MWTVAAANKKLDGPLSSYNSLTDEHLSHYFSNHAIKQHLIEMGLVTKKGKIMSPAAHKKHLRRQEHKKQIDEMLATAIVQKSLYLERLHKSEMRRQLSDLTKIELVERVKSARSRHKPQEGNSLPPRSLSACPSLSWIRGKTSPTSQLSRMLASCSHRPWNTTTFPNVQDFLDEGSTDDMNESEKIEHQRPAQNKRKKKRKRFSKASKNDTIQAMDNTELKRVDQNSLQLNSISQYYADLTRRLLQQAASPYLLPLLSQTYKCDISSKANFRSRSAGAKRTNSALQKLKSVGINRASSASGRPKSALRKSSEETDRQQTFPYVNSELQKEKKNWKKHLKTTPEVGRNQCAVTLLFHGTIQRMKSWFSQKSRYDKQEVVVLQQHCGGHPITVYKNQLTPGDEFTFTSRRHMGYPYSVVIFVDGLRVLHLSTCCEYRHKIGTKLGGKQGQFSLVNVYGSHPCFRCHLESQLLLSRPRHPSPCSKNNGRFTLTLADSQRHMVPKCLTSETAPSLTQFTAFPSEHHLDSNRHAEDVNVSQLDNEDYSTSSEVGSDSSETSINRELDNGFLHKMDSNEAENNQSYNGDYHLDKASSTTTVDDDDRPASSRIEVKEDEKINYMESENGLGVDHMDCDTLEDDGKEEEKLIIDELEDNKEIKEEIATSILYNEKTENKTNCVILEDDEEIEEKLSNGELESDKDVAEEVASDSSDDEGNEEVDEKCDTSNTDTDRVVDDKICLNELNHELKAEVKKSSLEDGGSIKDVGFDESENEKEIRDNTNYASLRNREVLEKKSNSNTVDVADRGLEKEGSSSLLLEGGDENHIDVTLTEGKRREIEEKLHAKCLSDDSKEIIENTLSTDHEEERVTGKYQCSEHICREDAVTKYEKDFVLVSSATDEKLNKDDSEQNKEESELLNLDVKNTGKKSELSDKSNSTQGNSNKDKNEERHSLSVRRNSSHILTSESSAFEDIVTHQETCLSFDFESGSEVFSPVCSDTELENKDKLRTAFQDDTVMNVCNGYSAKNMVSRSSQQSNVLETTGNEEMLGHYLVKDNTLLTTSNGERQLGYQSSDDEDSDIVTCGMKQLSVTVDVHSEPTH
ncbi:glutamate-rich protein 3-like isoform X2 [Limulus polyphemus]|uniref:Glutamate-rich protein 3-like isoform X2 n=1 Tax=Limulus polyphemus TaxID=6850 RepID=A0ABM1TD97_LIMPO|nr:glutamate-rich protein 3-like isoform X2 [Limulus polyphemus]